MKPTIIFDYIVVSVLILLLSGAITLDYGWSLFSTITHRSGLNGNMYWYYRFSETQWAIYTGLVTFFACIFAGLQVVLVMKKNIIALKRTYWFFLVYIVAIILFEIYLASRFVPKG